MATTQSAAAYFSRPIRPDTLQRANFRIRSKLVSAGVKRSDAAMVAKAAVAAARHTRVYLDDVRALVKARSAPACARTLDSMRKTTLQLKELGDGVSEVLGRAKEAVGNGIDAAGLLEAWTAGGGPEELTAEGRLRHALSDRLGGLAPVRVSDIAHLACLWSDSQHYHAALRQFLRKPEGDGGDTASFLEAISGFLPDHAVPVDLEGLPGDPGLLEGLPAMIERLGGKPARRR